MTIKWGLIILYGVLITALVIACLYFFWKDGPVKPFVNSIIGNVQGLFSSKGIFSGLGTGGLQTWLPLIAGAATVIPSLIVAYVNNQRYKNELQAKKELAELAAKQTSELSKVSSDNTTANSKISELQAQLDALNGDTTAETLQKALGEKTTTIEQQANQIKELLTQNEALSKQPAQLAQELWGKSGGQIIEVAGEKYKIITKETLKVL